MEACAFCRIVAGETDAHVVYEDDQTAAFLDRNPAVPGHTLVVPKSHSEFLFTDDVSVAEAVFETVRTVGMAIHETLGSDGVSLFYTSAELVGTVTHAHVHVLPRYADDDIHLALARESVPDDEAARLAARIRDRC
ncbi:MAG: HIT family protein [Halobacteriales archaeon]